MSEPQAYLNLRDQRELLTRISVLASQSPLRETILYQHGPFVAGAIGLPATIIFWRCGFRAFNLYKYNKNRLATLLISMSAPVNYGFFHDVLVNSKLQDFFRREGALHYGIKSFISNQLGIISSFTLTSFGTFYCAQRIGIIPVPDFFYQKESRAYTLNYYKTQLRPFVKTMAMTWAITSVLMFFVGMAEYNQSKALLAKLNRKTLSSKEN